MSTNQSLAYPTIIPICANPAYKERTSRARDITFSVMFVYLHDLADGAILLRKLAIHASNAASRFAQLPFFWYVYLQSTEAIQ